MLKSLSSKVFIEIFMVYRVMNGVPTNDVSPKNLLM